MPQVASTSTLDRPDPAGNGSPRTAIVLTGGGARAAYQVGLLRCLARHMPEVRLPIITGVSAGAINAAYLAARRNTLAKAAEELTALWTGLTADKVFRVGSLALARNVLRWGLRLISGGGPTAPQVRGLLDTQPLRRLLQHRLDSDDSDLPGIAENLESGRLAAFALVTHRYATGQTVTWVQGCDLSGWERPNRLGVKCLMTVEHVMASAALPLIFPAVHLGGSWYGDGGVRMTAPLAPAIHLGADRILAISTRYSGSPQEAATPASPGYPPPAQVLGAMLNAVFHDAIDMDALRLERINLLLARLPRRQWNGLKPIRLLTLRPSQDLGRLSARFELKLPRGFRFLTRGLGTRETESPDFLSLLMFQPDYLRRLIEIGEEDAEARLEEIQELFSG